MVLMMIIKTTEWWASHCAAKNGGDDGVADWWGARESWMCMTKCNSRLLNLKPLET